MKHHALIDALGFKPKENTSNIFVKKYANGYTIEADFNREQFDYGDKITLESSTTLGFQNPENWVVLECVDRLLTKGYKPDSITLEKTWKTGHGTSGRLDILVSRDDGTAYLMIECKTWGKEFDKEYKNLEKNGGQLFTYFQQDKNAEILMLYASHLYKKEGKDAIEYRNEIIKVEEDLKQTANVKDFFERWNKLPKQNGIFESWVTPYDFQSRALLLKDLKSLKQADSSFIFNRFLEILRHNVVSDKPNAFNKIFTLFLCKIIDEDRKPDDQLEFQWLEGEDDHITFQKRLTDLYNRGMKELLEKNVTDVSDSEFDKQFFQVEDEYKEKFKAILTEVRLKKNNEFAIKEVYDDESFLDNAKVVKEIVELLQVYKIRYNYRQQFLSDFFEMLLTTGLKQESGQFFTPVPVARFIIRSLPLEKITHTKIAAGNKTDLLPTIIDYAVGSGHFITESMEEVQRFVDALNPGEYPQSIKRAITKWQSDQFDWAEDYVYGIEKDYRLVKTAKVSCYLHGDGLAKVIHGDGLGDFATAKEYKDLLTITDSIYPQDNKQFDVVISNPPYSVSAFKGNMMDEDKANSAFDLYSRLTDQSGEIECLFIERTKQLLKDGGVAGIILPSSILSNSGIYTQAREIILKYFDIIAIAELGSATFMATGTNTVTLFLRRRNNADWLNVKASVAKTFDNSQDITINGIQNPLAKYVAHVWEGLSFVDYKTLLNKAPNEALFQHEIYQDYAKKLKTKGDALIDAVLQMEKEKLMYFVLAYKQKIVLVKTGQKKAEKAFLGYEFSNRRGNEGIHPIQRSKTIDDCTSLYDAQHYVNADKASTYIYRAFTENDFRADIPKSLQNNVSYQNLIDMMTFDRAEFEKNINLNAKKKIKIESLWDIYKLGKLMSICRGASPRPIKKYVTEGADGVNWIKIGDVKPDSKYITNTAEKITQEGAKKSRIVNEGDFILSNSMSFGRPYIMSISGCIHDGWLLLSDFDDRLDKNYLHTILSNDIVQQQFYSLASGGTAVDNLNIEKVSQAQIPLPPKDVQEKIVNEIGDLEQLEKKQKDTVNKLRKSILSLVKNERGDIVKLSDVCELKAGNFVKSDNISHQFGIDLYPCYGGNGLRGYTATYTNDGLFALIGRQGALCGNVHLVKDKFHATEHALVAYPKQNVNTKWLYHYLKSMKLNQYATGTAQPGLSVTNLKPLPIHKPSLQAQQKIVAEIEAIEAQIAELELQIAEIPAKKEAVLQKHL